MFKLTAALMMLIIGAVFPPALLLVPVLVGRYFYLLIRRSRPARRPNLDGWDPETGLAHRSPSEWARTLR